MPFHQKEILKIAEGLYDRLLRTAVNNTIYPLTATQPSLKPIKSLYNAS
jgi:hypothetical protein